MLMALAKAVIIGGSAVYAAEYAMGLDAYGKADPNMQAVYKYGAAGAGAIAAGLAVHALFGGSK